MAMFEKKARVAKPKKAMWARDGRKKGANVISFSVKSPADRLLGVDDMFGAYLMADGSIGVMQDFDEYEKDYGEGYDDEYEDDYEDEDDDEYVGEALIDLWYRDGTTYEGGCYAYTERQQVRDWCELNEYPLPVRQISFDFGDALQGGASAEDVFAILDDYLAGKLDNPDIALAALY